MIHDVSIQTLNLRWLNFQAISGWNHILDGQKPLPSPAIIFVRDLGLLLTRNMAKWTYQKHSQMNLNDAQMMHIG